MTEQGGDLVENDPSFHTDVDRRLFEKGPLESQSSSLSSLVTLTTPGVVADSNGLFHGLGDHADNSFSYDGQPITDQQSKVFSNQIPSESIQSMEVVSGGVPAEFGDKTSVIVKVTTRSGLGQLKPTGSVSASYGNFGTVNGCLDFGIGGKKWGNFIAGSGLNTGRFLDPPEFEAFHSKGNLQNIFDRVDYQISNADSVHLNFDYSRSWFQTPNSFDQLNIGVSNPVTGAPLGPTDQRSLIKTYNIAPVWDSADPAPPLSLRSVRLSGTISTTTIQVLMFLQTEPASFREVHPRLLTRTGSSQTRAYGLTFPTSKESTALKAGVVFEHTFLDEQFNFGDLHIAQF